LRDRAVRERCHIMLENVTPKKRRAVEALLTNPDVTQAAKASGVSRNTLYRWMKEPDFMVAVANAEADALTGMSRALVKLGDQAAAVLRDAMNDPETPINTRLRAADTVFSRLLQLRELVNVEKRVTELEERVSDGDL